MAILGKLFGKGDSGKPTASGAMRLAEDYEEEIDIAEAQVESFRRLKREADARTKLEQARGLGLEFARNYPQSVDAQLALARGARLAGDFRAAEALIDTARTRAKTDTERHNINFEQGRLIREGKIAEGDPAASAVSLIIYACQRCGGLIEFLSAPCPHCMWRSSTIVEVAYGQRLSSFAVPMSQLLYIAREIQFFKKPATTAVANLEEVVREDLADVGGRLCKLAKETYELLVSKGEMLPWAWRAACKCSRCGTLDRMYSVTKCNDCGTALRRPPPLQLLLCLMRLNSHFVGNLNVPEQRLTAPDGSPSWTVGPVDNFVKLMVTLESKLCRLQETPTDRERARVLALMKEIGELPTHSNFAAIIVKNPEQIMIRIRPDLTEEQKENERTVASDFASAIQYMAQWMMKRKALC